MRWRRVLVVLTLAGLGLGCSDAFDPFAGVEAGFSLVGVLDARQDTQFVRVDRVADRDTEPQLGDAEVTSEDLISGAVVVWQDSLVTLRDGSAGLLFFAPFAPEIGTTYRLTALGQEGSGTSVFVEMPAPPALTAAEPREIGSVISQLLTFAGAEEPEMVEVFYTVRRRDNPTPVAIGAGYPVRPASGGTGFEVLVALSRDAVRIQNALNVDPDDPGEVTVERAEVRYAVEDPARGQIEGGFGAVGAAAAFVVPWTIPTETVEALGFIDAQGD